MAYSHSVSGAAKRYISLDVECVATGKRHDDRDVCFVAVVDDSEKVLLKKKVKPEKRIVSYLTPLTGFREGALDDGEKLGDVITDVKRILGPDVVLIGQSVQSDIKWLQLQEGTDYQGKVELSVMFRAYNRRYGNESTFSLQHEANTLLHAGAQQLHPRRLITRTHGLFRDNLSSTVVHGILFSDCTIRCKKIKKFPAIHQSFAVD